jgi:hypothetical protein
LAPRNSFSSSLIHFQYHFLSKDVFGDEKDKLGDGNQSMVVHGVSKERWNPI